MTWTYLVMTECLQTKNSLWFSIPTLQSWWKSNKGYRVYLHTESICITYTRSYYKSGKMKLMQNLQRPFQNGSF